MLYMRFLEKIVVLAAIEAHGVDAGNKNAARRFRKRMQQIRKAAFLARKEAMAVIKMPPNPDRWAKHKKRRAAERENIKQSLRGARAAWREAGL